MTPRTLAGCALFALFCSCTGTSLKKTWKSPDYKGAPLTKLAVLAIDERRDLRIGFENRLVQQIQKNGASAITTFDLFSLPEVNSDKAGAARRLQSAGAEALVLLRLRDISSAYRESRPGDERYAETITGFEMGPWYDYFSVAYADMSPTYGNLKQKVFLETSVYDLKTAKRLWSGLTETVVTDTMDRIAEMDPIVAKAVAAMRKDAIIP